jgi:hypothetical protein
MENRKRTSFYDGEWDIRPALFVAVEEDPLTVMFCVLVTVKFGWLREKVEMNLDDEEEGHVSPFVQV